MPDPTDDFAARHPSFDQLVADLRVFFIDGIVQGKPLGASVGQMITKARVWGIHDRAINPEGGVGARVVRCDPDDLVRRFVEIISVALFSGEDLPTVILALAKGGAAYGREDFSETLQAMDTAAA